MEHCQEAKTDPAKEQAVRIVTEIEEVLKHAGSQLPDGGSYSERNPRLPDRRLPLNLQMDQLWLRRETARRRSLPYNHIDNHSWAWPPAEEVEPAKEPSRNPVDRMVQNIVRRVCGI